MTAITINTGPKSASRMLKVIALCTLSCLMSACVTEKTGGFQQDNDAVIVENYLQVARAYFQAQDYMKVRQTLNRVSQYDPNNAEMFGIWALLYAQEGDLELADDSFNRALRLDRGDSLIRNNYAAFLFENNRIEDAFDQLRLVVQDTEYPGRPRAFENLGLTAMRLDRDEEAEEAFNRALQLENTRIRSATELVDLALARDDLTAAQDYYEDVLTLLQFYGQRLEPRHLLQGIRLSRAQGNLSQATQLAGTLATTFPDSPEYRIYQQTIVNE